MCLQDLCDLCAEFKISVCAPDKATLKAENHALQCRTARPYNAKPFNLFEVGDLVGITPSALRLATELQHGQPRFTEALRKSKRLVGTIALLFSFFLPSGRKNFLFRPWPLAQRMLLILLCRLDCNAHSMKFRKLIKKQKVATGLLLDKLHEQDFAGPLSSRASKVLGPISRYRIADILPHIKLVSRASRPGLTVGFLRILCHGLCTAQRRN